MAAQVEYTPYARKYGITNEPFLEDGHSGLTPLGPFPPNLPQEDPAGFLYRSNLAHYQRWEMYRFETQNFVDSGAMSDPDVRTSNLREIHPIFDRNMWETELPSHLAFYPLGHGREGEFWRADNDDVWRVLVPCVALASKIMDNFHFRPWWDALIFGDREPIPSPPAPPNYEPLQRFFARPAQQSGSEDSRKECRAKFLECLVNLKWGISSSYCEPENGLRVNHADWLGVSTARFCSTYDDNVRIHLSFEELTPLLFGNITKEERLILQFYIAETLVHEFAHAAYMIMDPESHIRAEPYYEDEGVCELGYSWTNSIFGGRTFKSAFSTRKCRWRLRGIPPLGLIFEEGFPTPNDRCSHYPVLDPRIEYGIGLWDSFLVPIKYVANMQRQSFWDNYVPVYGASAITPQPLVYGIREERSEVDGPETLGYLLPEDFEDDQTDEHMTVRSSLARRMRNRRIVRAQQLHEIMAQWVGQKLTEPEISDRVPRFSGENDGRSKFDPDAVDVPQNIGSILQTILTYRYELCVDTMHNWTPSNLFLDYIHRTAPIRISKEDFELFLTSCQAHGQFFRFRRYGNGEMRTIDAGWPAANPPPKQAMLPMLYPRRFANTVRQSRLLIYRHDGKSRLMVDFDRDLFYHELGRIWARKYNVALQRNYFDSGMAHLDYKKRDVIFGPCNTYRLLVNPPLNEVESEDDPDQSSDEIADDENAGFDSDEDAEGEYDDDIDNDGDVTMGGTGAGTGTVLGKRGRDDDGDSDNGGDGDGDDPSSSKKPRFRAVVGWALQALGYS